MGRGLPFFLRCQQSRVRSIRSRGRESEEDQRRSAQVAPRRKETSGETEERTGWSCGSLEGAVPRNSAASSTDNAHHGQASRERQRHEGQEVLRRQLQRRPETMHQVDSGCTSSPRVHARTERLEANKDTGSCANQGREGQSNDEQGSQGYQGRSQGRQKRRWLFLKPKEAPKEVNRETSTAKVRLCTKTESGAEIPGTSSQRRTSPWRGAEPSEE